MYKKKKTSKKKNLEHKSILQESCKNLRRWQRSILLVKGGRFCENNITSLFVLLFS